MKYHHRALSGIAGVGVCALLAGDALKLAPSDSENIVEARIAQAAWGVASVAKDTKALWRCAGGERLLLGRERRAFINAVIDNNQDLNPLPGALPLRVDTTGSVIDSVYDSSQLVRRVEVDGTLHPYVPFRMPDLFPDGQYRCERNWQPFK